MDSSKPPPQNPPPPPPSAPPPLLPSPPLNPSSAAPLLPQPLSGSLSLPSSSTPPSNSLSILGSPPSSPISKTPSLSQNPNSTSSPPNHPVDPSHPLSWSSKVKSSIRTLRKIPPPSSQTRKFHTHIPDSVYAEGADRFSNFILAQFYGRTPAAGKISHLANLLWGKLTPVKVIKLDDGDLVFRLNSKEARDHHLSKPLWYLGNLPLFLSEWRPGFKPEKPSLIRAPIWVIFRDLPCELLTHTALSYLASVLGDPLFPDKATENLTRFDQARVCIEVNVLEPLPDSISVSFDNGSEIQVKVEYPWKPPVCDSCGAVGHPVALCPSVKRIWKPKSSSVVPSDSNPNTAASSSPPPPLSQPPLAPSQATATHSVIPSSSSEPLPSKTFGSNPPSVQPPPTSPQKDQPPIDPQSLPSLAKPLNSAQSDSPNLHPTPPPPVSKTPDPDSSSNHLTSKPLAPPATKTSSSRPPRQTAIQANEFIRRTVDGSRKKGRITGRGPQTS